MKRFALIGAAGYIAPRHMNAIKQTQNQLITAVDKSDSVGVIDSYFPDADFFTEFERFDRHIEKLRCEKGCGVDYVSICSPNYLHDAHIRFALRVGADAICEKPVVLNPWNIDALADIELQTGRKVYNILQLRLHPAVIALKHQVETSAAAGKHDVDLTYITPRGRWYLYSWKGDVSKSGGVATNIGIHFFDMLIWVFGSVRDSRVHISEPTRAAGFLELEKARVRWLLSIDRRDLPARSTGSAAPDSAAPKAYRSIKVDGDEVEFSDGFKDLHTKSYVHILEGRGFRLDDARPAIELAHSIRNAQPVAPKDHYHRFLKRPLRADPGLAAARLARRAANVIKKSPHYV